MIPAPFWVDGWGWLYEMVLSGRYLPTTRAASPWGATLWAWGDCDGQCGLPWPCSPVLRKFHSHLLQLRVSSGLTGVLGLSQPCTPVPAPFPWSHGAPPRG